VGSSHNLVNTLGDHCSLPLTPVSLANSAFNYLERSQYRPLELNLAGAIELGNIKVTRSNTDCLELKVGSN
jgi:hypothetical protein